MGSLTLQQMNPCGGLPLGKLEGYGTSSLKMFPSCKDVPVVLRLLLACFPHHVPLCGIFMFQLAHGFDLLATLFLLILRFLFIFWSYSYQLKSCNSKSCTFLGGQFHSIIYALTSNFGGHLLHKILLTFVFITSKTNYSGNVK